MVMSRTEFYDILKTLQKKEFTLDSGERELPQMLLESFCHYIGDPDPVLRDDLNYPAFATWANSNAFYSDETAAQLIERLTGNDYMGYKIGSVDDDAVFKRSFSALIVAVLLNRHMDQPYLSEAQLVQTGTRALSWFSQEQDWRSFVNEKGWAHSLAHTADLFDQLLSCPDMWPIFLVPVLEAFSNKLAEPNAVLTGEEDERFVTAIVKPFFESDVLSEIEKQNWIEVIGNRLDTAASQDRKVLAVNNKHFLRSLYFRGEKFYPNSIWLKPLHEAQEKLNRYL